MTTSRTAAGHRWLDGARRRYRGSVSETFVQRLNEVNFGTAITLIGATALLSALPFLLLMDSFASRRIEDDLVHHMGLNDRAARIVDGHIHTPSFHSIPAIVLALLFSLLGMVSLAGMVQHLCEQTFDLPHARGRGQLLPLLLWIVILCGWFALDSLIVTATRGLPGGPLLAAVAVLLAVTAFFWVSMRLLLGRRMPGRTLLLPAAISGLFWLGLQDSRRSTSPRRSSTTAGSTDRSAWCSACSPGSPRSPSCWCSARRPARCGGSDAARRVPPMSPLRRHPASHLPRRPPGRARRRCPSGARLPCSTSRPEAPPSGVGDGPRTCPSRRGFACLSARG